jgi:ATP phosphoribosyltransferase
LSIAIPKKSRIKKIEQLKNARIVTAYPNSAQEYFREKNIPVKVTTLSGSVEIAPALGIADAIVDLVSTGRTLTLNKLKMFKKIYNSQAMLIKGVKNNLSPRKQILMKKLIERFKKIL